jgi:hypothetical protein
MRSVFSIALVLSTLSAFAGDHTSQYKVGIFSSTGQLRDGSYSNGQTRGVATYTAHHNIHYVRTDDGMYSIYSPSVLGKTFLFKPLTNDGTLTDDDMMPNVHKQWFMDKLHDGDKVLFAAKCDKNNNCWFWLPNPDKPGLEFTTQGYYLPDAIETTPQSLCGTGKLTPQVAAEVCH